MNLRLYALVLGVIFMTSCAESTPSKVAVQRVKCETAKSLCEETVSVSYPAKIAAVADVNLSFRVAGVVDRIAVDAGAYVREGDVVAYMDKRDYKLQLEATQAEYDAIKGEVDRVVALYEDRSVSQNDYEKATNGLKQITAKLSAHRNALQDTELKAPFNGYVQRVNFDRGEAVSAGMPIMKFVSASSPEVIVNLPVVEYLRRGDLLRAEATVGAFPARSFRLECVGISHKANLNQLHEARFRVLSDDGVYPTMGMSAMVSLTYGGGEGSKVTIPVGAIVERGGRSYVWQIVDGKAKLRGVEVEKIGRSGEATIRGVKSGDMIITAGVNNLKDGQSVEPLATPTESNVGNIL